MVRLSPALLVALGLTSCQREAPPTAKSTPQPAPETEPDTASPPAALENWERDVLSTRLALDYESHSGTATIELAAGTPGASFEADGLEVSKVTHEGMDLAFRLDDKALHIAAPAGEASIEITYVFTPQEKLEGAKGGLTLTWPYHCDRVFPCDTKPDDGTEFELQLKVPAGKTAIYPTKIDEQAPAYMLAWAVGEYERVDLEPTRAGTKVSVWFPPARKEASLRGTRNLSKVFDWFESTYGAYLYGDHVGSVLVEWGGGAFGGMEHHPYWHVAAAGADDESVHAHEAAHGWYGNGVRIACWEDFVLSEGTVTYMATRAIEEVAGKDAGGRRWNAHQDRIDQLLASERSKIAWPEGCNEIDIIEDGLFGPAPYVKGAMFYRAVAEQIGVEKLDGILRDFYLDHRGQAARFAEMLDAIEKASGYDPRPCAEAWLRREKVPAPEACRPAQTSPADSSSTSTG